MPQHQHRHQSSRPAPGVQSTSTTRQRPGEHQRALGDPAEPAQRELVGAHLHEHAAPAGPSSRRTCPSRIVAAEPLDVADDEVGEPEAERGGAVQEGDLAAGRSRRGASTLANMTTIADEVDAGDDAACATVSTTNDVR